MRSGSFFTIECHLPLRASHILPKVVEIQISHLVFSSFILKVLHGQSKFSLRRETRGVTAHVLVRLKEHRTVVMVPYNLSRDLLLLYCGKLKLKKSEQK